MLHFVIELVDKISDKKIEHWKEFINKVEEVSESDNMFVEYLNKYKEINYRTHMHVFNYQSLLETLKYIKENIVEEFAVIDEFHFPYGFEILFVIEKRESRHLKIVPFRLFKMLRNSLIALFNLFGNQVAKVRLFRFLKHL